MLQNKTGRPVVQAPKHPERMSPAFARWMAVQLVERADAAEGYAGPHGFVSRVDMLVRLNVLEQQIAEYRGAGS